MNDIIENFLVRFCAPIGWLPSLDASAYQLKCKTGTCVLIDTGKVRVFVTCEHVWTQWKKYKSKHPAAELLVGLDNGTPCILSNAELVDSDAKCDLAVVKAEIDPQQLISKAFFRIEEFPIPLPNVGDFMIIIGFPGRGRIAFENGITVWKPTRLGYPVSSVSPSNIILAPEKNDRKSYENGNEIDHFDIGGMSGSPAFLLRLKGMPLLAGFLYEGKTSDNFIFLTPARYLQADGKLRGC
jgi:hypothetical protein